MPNHSQLNADYPNRNLDMQTCPVLWLVNNLQYFLLLITHLVKLEDEDLIKRIEESGMDKTEVDNVEILFNTNFILPPSPSVCKKTKKIRKRELLVPGTLLLNPNEEQLTFIKQLINFKT